MRCSQSIIDFIVVSQAVRRARRCRTSTTATLRARSRSRRRRHAHCRRRCRCRSCRRRRRVVVDVRAARQRVQATSLSSERRLRSTEPRAPCRTHRFGELNESTIKNIHEQIDTHRHTTHRHTTERERGIPSQQCIDSNAKRSSQINVGSTRCNT